MIFEGGGFKFEAVAGWGNLPAGLKFGDDIPGVATDSRNRVYIFNRSEHPVMVFESDGRFLGTWGEKDFPGRPHGITITPDDVVWCTDDTDHTVRKFTLDGTLLQIIGTPGTPSDTGYVPTPSLSLESIKRGAGPFNRPTKVAEAPGGDLFITDGYGNARVHHFTAAGEYLQSWGQPGDGPGQFHLPHALVVSLDGRIYVCDRENDRIQIFSRKGNPLHIWNMEGRPLDLAIDKENRLFISVGRWAAGKKNLAGKVMTKDAEAHLLIADLEGNTIAKWGASNYGELDTFVAPHGMCIDSEGNWYVVENGQRVLSRMGISRPNYPSVRKYARVR